MPRIHPAGYSNKDSPHRSERPVSPPAPPKMVSTASAPNAGGDQPTGPIKKSAVSGIAQTGTEGADHAAGQNDRRSLNRVDGSDRHGGEPGDQQGT